MYLQHLANRVNQTDRVRIHFYYHLLRVYQ
jgi:hypothetical protein